MPSKEKYPIYQACVKNFQEIDSGRKQFEKVLNVVIRDKCEAEIDKLTKVYSILFSSWAEARFFKLLYTPYGFDDSEIQTILEERSVEDKWLKLLKIGLRKISSGVKKIPGLEKRLESALSQFVIEPAHLRNKFAHGQWKFALNYNGTKVNADTSEIISILSPIDVSNWFHFFSKVSDLIETLVESPEKSFSGDYWTVFAEIEKSMEERKKWTLKEKKELLKKKSENQKNS